MIDDGFSRREVLARMHELDLNENDVHALGLTHEHSDHERGASATVKRSEGPPVLRIRAAGQNRPISIL